MTVSLQSLDHIRSTLLVKIEIARYRTTEGAFPTQKTILFNDSIYDIVTSEGVFLGMGGLTEIGSTKNAIRNQGSAVSIGLSGIPQENTREILYSDIKGSVVTIARGFFFPGTNTLISDLDIPVATGGFVGRFGGFISTYTIEDAVDQDTQTSTVNVVFECSPLTSLYKKITRGLRTNPKDLLFRTNNEDVSFNRVPALENKEFFFGKPA